MALTNLDRELIDECLARKPKAWENFVNRFMGLVVHVINHTCQARSLRLSPEDREDLCSEVFLTIIRDDFALLRHFRGQCSLATYLAVVARRVVVRKLLERQVAAHLGDGAGQHVSANGNGALHHNTSADDVEKRVSDRDEVQRMLEELEDDEAQIVRMYHLEGKSYREISTAVGMPENSVGPTLTRAREKMRRAGE